MGWAGEFYEESVGVGLGNGVEKGIVVRLSRVLNCMKD